MDVTTKGHRHELKIIVIIIMKIREGNLETEENGRHGKGNKKNQDIST